jgi:hypothetical protein
MKLNAWLVLVVGSVITTLAIAKLPAAPPQTEEQKAKAAEAKEKAADAAKKDATDLGRYQDKNAERYFREMKAAGKTVPAATWVPPPPPVVTAAAAQPSSSESLGQKQTVAPKTQDTANPAAAKASTNAKPTPAKG